MNELKDKNILSNEQLCLFTRLSGGSVEKLFHRYAQKVNYGKVPKDYPPEIIKFALNLNFFSPKSYEYVRETFANCLPAQSTISSWYKTIDLKPCFSIEAFNALNKAVSLAGMTSHYF